MTKSKFGPFDCPLCGAPRMNVKAGSVCSEGCGKIHPPLPPAARQLNHAKIANFPVATLVKGQDVFTLDQFPGRTFLKANKFTRKIDGWPDLEVGEFVAIYEGEVFWFLEQDPDLKVVK